MDEEPISLVQECTNKYFIERVNENEIEIHIRIPTKYRKLWLNKISELNTTQEEIGYYENTNDKKPLKFHT